jgi:hypothetical protein
VTYAELQRVLAVTRLCALDNLLNLSCEFKRNGPHINGTHKRTRVGHVTRVGEGRGADSVLAGKPRSVGTK